jgi:hypothetical protein
MVFFSPAARADAYYGQPIGTQCMFPDDLQPLNLELQKKTDFPCPKDWNSPFSFFNPVYWVNSADGNQAVIGGGVGQFLGVW